MLHDKNLSQLRNFMELKVPVQARSSGKRNLSAGGSLVLGAGDR
jgi:hypothetical protein